jgi:DNA repair photolyase
MNLLRGADKIEVGLSVTTGDEGVSRLFEPDAPPIKKRIETLDKLHLARIRTFAMVAPMLPKAEGLATTLGGKVDYVLIDRMNYHYGDWVYRKHNLESAKNEDFFFLRSQELATAFKKAGTKCQLLF